MRFKPPVLQPVTSEYGEKGLRWDRQIDPKTGFWVPRADGLLGNHHGYDFDCPMGTTVCAIAPGVIVKSDLNDSCTVSVIQLVTMPGFDAWWVRYDHLVSAHAVLGQTVRRGEAIGHSGVGESGRAYLHVDLMEPRTHQYKPIQWES